MGRIHADCESRDGQAGEGVMDQSLPITVQQRFSHIGTVEVAPLLARIPDELWDEEQERQKYPGSPHVQAKSIILRWSENRSIEAAFRDVNVVDCPAAEALMPESGDVFCELLERLHLISPEIGRVMLTKLPPGSSIAEHMDEGLYADYYDRFHICLQGDEGNTFKCGGETYHPKPGEVFWFNHKLKHSVENSGQVDRIHMIVDLVAPAYRAMRGLYYQAERSRDLWKEITPLLERHWWEISTYLDIPLDPDVERYNVMDDAGLLRCYTARFNGELIGYVVLICASLHYKSTKIANQDVLFLLPEYRRGRAGIGLIKFAEERLRQEGFSVIYQHQKIEHPALGVVLEKIGYKKIEHIWAKRLERS